MADSISPELLERLMREHGAALALFAAQWTEQPDDCLQEAFLASVRRNKPPDDVVPWLFRVVRNRAVSTARAAQRRRRHETLACKLKPSWLVSQTDPGEAESVTEALRSLDEEYREVIVARIWGRLTFEQIADVVGVSISTAFAG